MGQRLATSTEPTETTAAGATTEPISTTIRLVSAKPAVINDRPFFTRCHGEGLITKLT